jgi:UDP-glucose 4-epimerase
VNLAFGTRSTLLELLDLLEAQLGRPVTRTHVEARRGDIRDSQASSKRLRALLPDARPVPLEEGLASTIAWFREQAR